MNAFPGLPRGRAARIAYFEARVQAHEAADEGHAYKVLFRLANPSEVETIWQIKNGRVIGLSDHHERLRRACVLRAWCAQKLGWRNEFSNALFDAGTHKRLALAARKEGR